MSRARRTSPCRSERDDDLLVLSIGVGTAIFLSLVTVILG